MHMTRFSLPDSVPVLASGVFWKRKPHTRGVFKVREKKSYTAISVANNWLSVSVYISMSDFAQIEMNNNCNA